MIFAAIAIAWLAYLVPHFVRRRDGEFVLEDETASADRFAESMRIVRHGTAPLLDQDLEEIRVFEVSTPQTRRAAIKNLRRLETVAALRRRRVLLTLMAVLSLTIGVCAVDVVPWWATAIPGGLLVAFFVLSRVSVRMMQTDLDARYREITHGSNEKTVLISRKDLVKADPKPAAPVIQVDTDKPGVLWDPVPITVPTYVSKPLAPRTVRTIDLSGPGVTSSGRLPVTADAPMRVTASEAAEGEPRKAASA